MDCNITSKSLCMLAVQKRLSLELGLKRPHVNKQHWIQILVNHSDFLPFQIRPLLWQQGPAWRSRFKTELGKNGGTSVNTISGTWNILALVLPRPCGPVEMLKVVTKRIQIVYILWLWPREKEEIIDMVETMTIFLFVILTSFIQSFEC